MSAALTDDDYKWAALRLACEVAAIKAVVQIEAPNGGFYPDGRPVILFEAYHFSRLTKGKFDQSHAHVSSNHWNRALYRKGVAEWQRLEEAIALDRRAALMSASWGRFQIMGFNFGLCGFTSVEDFVAAMQTSERAQVEAFVEFVKERGLDDELVRRDWTGFARGFNGIAFRENKYDARLAMAYVRAKRGQL